MFDNWVIDATVTDTADQDLFCFCPIEGDPHGEYEVVTGMNFISDRPPGVLVGIVHAEGDDAVEAWVAANLEPLAFLKERVAASSTFDSPEGGS